MTMDNAVDRARAAALTRIERSERTYRRAFAGAAVAEALLLVAFLSLADLHNRTHLLLLLATVGIYSVLGMGLLTLGAHVRRQTLLLLQAIEGIAPEPTSRREGENGGEQ